jgi:hypothetical protein
MAATITHKLVSLTDAADILAVSTKTVRRYIADGHLDAYGSGARRCGSSSTRSRGSSTPDQLAGGGEQDDVVSRLASLAPQPPVERLRPAQSDRFLVPRMFLGNKPRPSKGPLTGINA